MLHKGTTDGPRHQPFIDHSAVFSLLTSVARSVELFSRGRLTYPYLSLY